MPDPTTTPSVPADPPSATPPARRWRARRSQVAAGARVALDRASGPLPAMAAAWLAAMLLAAIQSARFTVLIALGFSGAFVAGLVGIGGSIVMFPLLLYAPPRLGAPALDPHTVAGVTMVQGMAAAVTGMLAHRRRGGVEASLVTTLGLATILASFVGSIASSLVSPAALSGVFASLAVVAALLMLGGPRHRLSESSGTLEFNRIVAVALGAATGFLAGMVGAGGGFILVPLMVYVLTVPVRVAIGSSLAIVALSATAGTIGKALSGQVDWMLALALVTGALPGARLGASVGTRISARALARLLGLVIAAIAAKMWWDLLAG